MNKDEYKLQKIVLFKLLPKNFFDVNIPKMSRVMWHKTA